MRVLVTGAAGYIGSHAVRALLQEGHHVVALDNLSRGHRSAVPVDVEFHRLDVRETERLGELLMSAGIECVMHFAAFTYVGESAADPLMYYDNNTKGTLSLLQAMARAATPRLVFSSTAATYGEPESVPIVEDSPQLPINPYGWSKLFGERMIRDEASRRSDFSFAIFRYFNVAGAAAGASIGEDHRPETHLVPLVLSAALGRLPQLTIYGDDYATADGTCIRDYVHVEDLVGAHVLVLGALEAGQGRIYNIGIGHGYSVKQILDAAERVVGRPIPRVVGPRRAGDPAELFADPGKIERELGWVARHTDLDAIIDSALRWHTSHPDGFGD